MELLFFCFNHLFNAAKPCFDVTEKKNRGLYGFEKLLRKRVSASDTLSSDQRHIITSSPRTSFNEDYTAFYNQEFIIPLLDGIWKLTNSTSQTYGPYTIMDTPCSFMRNHIPLFCLHKSQKFEKQHFFTLKNFLTQMMRNLISICDIRSSDQRHLMTTRFRGTHHSILL